MLISATSFLSSADPTAQPLCFDTSNNVDDSTQSINDLSTYDLSMQSLLKDRSLNYGDGCFTTIYAEGTQVSLFNEHIQRLYKDGKKLGLHIEPSSLSRSLVILMQHFLISHQHYLQQNTSSSSLAKEKDAVAIKVLISRGEGTRGYAPSKDAKLHVMLTFQETNKVLSFLAANTTPTGLNDYRYQVLAANMRLSIQPLLAGLKHNNRLEQVLAKKELLVQDADDILLCDQLGKVVEVTSANVFFYIDGVWHTPELDSCGVAGVMRGAVLNFMRMHKIAYSIGYLRFDDIFNASAMFTTNALTYIKPVTCFVRGRQKVEFDLKQFPKELNDFNTWASAFSVNVSKDIGGNDL